MNPKSEPVVIVADDRERASGVIAALEAIGDTVVHVGRLPLGDYLVERRVLFERKSLTDFAASLAGGRLLNQMLRLANSSLKTVLILEEVKGIGEKTAQRIRWAVSESMERYGDDFEFPI